MARGFRPEQPFKPEDFPSAERPFPLAEVFGYQRELRTPAARQAFADRHCPFAGNECEKFRQYKYGYCSVHYRADGDDAPQVYAVCDHRLDGAPVAMAVRDFFGAGADKVHLVPEVVLTEPRQSFDFIALERTGDRFIGIEAQAIDLRGGGVGPAFASMIEGDPASWRQRFSDEAETKGRSDTVAYGVNTANIYKRLGLQVAEKAAMLRAWDSHLYVVTQGRPFNYLMGRTRVDWLTAGEDWDITFVVFDYTGAVLDNGQMGFEHVGTYRTEVATFAEALVNPTSSISASDFLRRVRKKAGLDR